MHVHSSTRFKNVFCVGVAYSGEYDVCDVTLSVYPHRASLKNMSGHGGNRTYDLWSTSPMLCQLSYAVRSVRVSNYVGIEGTRLGSEISLT